jgi:four helix bundle protein
MRDHRKLKAWHLADALALTVYRATLTFAKAELFGLTAQMRRGAVSVASNIVEGSARRSEADYLRFLDMAFAAARELQYHVSLAQRLGYLKPELAEELESSCTETCRVLSGLMRSLREPAP